MFEIKIHGAEEIERKLKRLGDGKSVRKVLNTAGQKNAKKIQKTARDILQSKTNKKTGHLFRSIRLKTSRASGRIKVSVICKDPKAYWFEYGTMVRKHKSGKDVGMIQAVGFMRGAWESNKGTAVGEFLDTARKEIERIVK